MAAVTAAARPSNVRLATRTSAIWRRAMTPSLSLNLPGPEARRVSDPSFSRRPGSESETVTNAAVLPILDVGAQFAQRRHSPFHGRRRGDGVGITNGNE